LLALHVTVHDSSLATWLQELRVHMARLLQSLLCASMSHFLGKKPGNEQCQQLMNSVLLSLLRHAKHFGPCRVVGLTRHLMVMGDGCWPVCKLAVAENTPYQDAQRD